MKTIIIIAFLFVCLFAKSQTIIQDVISSGGGYYENGNSKLSVTIGETLTDTYSNANNTLTQGFQQSDYNITSIEELAKEGISAIVFPNPTTNKINLKFEQKTNESISYVINDYSGKTIKNSDILKEETVVEIDFSTFASGIYFLKVFNKSGDFQKTFKVDKLK